MSVPLHHPTAVISPGAILGDNVRVGPFAIIEDGVTLGPGCVVGPHVHLFSGVTAGANNHFHTGCVIGDTPQHLAYAGEPTRVEIGDGNVFREHVTIHRAMPATGTTIIGSRCLFMVGSHVAHDCRVGDGAIFANCAVIGGHATVQGGAFLSGNSCVHQFCRVGRLAMLSGTSSVSQDLPPFWIVQEVNIARGVNVIGMRRAGIPTVEIQGVRRAYKTINRSGLTVADALAKIEAEDGHLLAVAELVAFIRESKRGIVTAGREAGDE
jgi:UDP-N-acetylglucosamine acyltransferase